MVKLIQGQHPTVDDVSRREYLLIIMSVNGSSANLKLVQNGKQLGNLVLSSDVAQQIKGSSIEVEIVQVNAKTTVSLTSVLIGLNNP
jgi:hypothetical protein